MSEQGCETVAQSFGVAVSRGRATLILVSVTLGVLFAALGQTIVGTALPRVVAELGGLHHYAWVFTGYTLASTITVPIYGKLSDIYGRRPCFLLGMSLFLVGSGLSGLSQDMTQLILFRAVQGLGAGGTMPIAQAIVGDLYPPAERGKWQGLLLGVFGLAAIVGPTGGGWITDNWGWRWVFYANMPVGVFALGAAGLSLPAVSGGQRRKVDYLGAALLVAAVVSLLAALYWADAERSWAAPEVAGLLVLALALAAAFLVVEIHAAEPIVDLALFRSHVFTASIAATFLASAGMYGVVMYLPLFVQGVVGESATGAGAVLTPMMLGFVLGSVVGGQISARTGWYRQLALGGFLIAAAGTFLLSRMGAAASSSEIVRNAALTGAGVGVDMSLFTIVVQNAFPSSRLGQVTASVQFFRMVGGAVGVALLGAVMAERFQSQLSTRTSAWLAQALPNGVSLPADPQTLLDPAAAAAMQQRLDTLSPPGAALFAQFQEAVRESLASALADVFAVSCALMVLGLLATTFLRELPSAPRRGPDAAAATLRERGDGEDSIYQEGERRCRE